MDYLKTAKNFIGETHALMDTVAMDIGGYHSFLLYLNGVEAHEIAAVPPYSNIIFVEFLDLLSTIEFTLSDEFILTFDVQMRSATIEYINHSLNAYFASMLGELSKFPESSLDTYYEVSELWTHFPVHYKFGEDESYYNNIVEKELELQKKFFIEADVMIANFVPL